MEARFHGTAKQHAKYSENSLNKAISEKRITEEDRDLLVRFVNEIQGTSQLSTRRRSKLFYVLIGCRRYLVVPFKDATYDDLLAGAAAIKSTQELSKNTIADYVRFLKRLYLWMAEKGYTEIPERDIRKIKSPAYDATTKTAEMMLDDTEVKAIVEHCKTSRDRAVIMLLYEGGFRIGEIASLTWDQVKFDKDFVLINVSGKTEIPRLVPCRDAKGYLLQYMNDVQIPTPPPRGEVVFWTIHKNQKVQMTYAAFAKILKQAAKAAGIEKHISPHLFRHSSITQAVRDGLGEQVIKSIYWGNPETGMLKTYSHITGNDIINAVRERYGLSIEPKKKKDRKTFGPRQCPVCGMVNVPTNKYCGKCGTGLTKEIKASQMKAEETAENLFAGVPVSTLTDADRAEIARMVAQEILSAQKPRKEKGKSE